MARKNNQEFFPFSGDDTANLRSDFSELLKNYSTVSVRNGELADWIIAKYSEKQRFYHNLSHVNTLLFSAEDYKKSFNDYDSVRLAIWFHDVIYEPKSFNNETESAKIMVEKLTDLNFPKSLIEKIETMILATQKHDAALLGNGGKLFLDLDLGILGAPESIYQKYAQAIRCEYSFVPKFLYRRTRAKILRSFLNRERIYFSDELYEKLETAARRNMANEIKELS